ncbi:YggU family protein [Aromatoleum toluvorans]|uniref:UPF0235 protein GPA22_18690 n=1 Tax=Aromatoleum toluvorans TaxID=92002 RepID=A0ABX1Q272_9RHOO|nr:DUF167 family protein [Aromatoleum toluvorans]NMG45748.1 YggU family protein [Aromatoleum toluvorans]
MTAAVWLREAADGSVVLTLHIQPGAKKTEFVGLHGEAMKIRLAAPPVDGKANAALCAFLAEFCGVPKSAVTLISGETSRAKRVRVAGASAGAAARLRTLGA